MATLTGTTIQSTYDSLLKVTDNDSITSSLKRITDGLGNNTPLYLSSSAVEIVSALNVVGNITGTNLSGTNTGDETKSSIETKLGAASASNSGYLTSGDWSTFNNKIAGLGTLNRVAKFSSTGSIADSNITDNGTLVSISTATTVTGNLTATNLIRSGGTASQILAADGSVITAGTNIVISGGTISSTGGINSLNGLTGSSQTFAVGTSGTDFNISSAGTTHTFNIPTASSSTRGLLSSADWVIFANRISGSGTTNFVPKFNGSTSVANSLIFDNGTNLGVGTTTPGASLDLYKATGESNIQLSSGTEYLRVFYRDTDDNAGLFINGLTRLRFIGSTGNAAILESGTGNFAVGASAATATTKLWVVGTGYFSDSVGIGSTSLTGFHINIGRTLTGSVTSRGIHQSYSVASDVTNAAIINSTSISTQAAAFTLPQLTHYFASQVTIGAGSAVTNQNGFRVDNTLIGATNNFAFRGEIPAGTGRWNLFMSGTAQNHIAGPLGIGTTSIGTNAIAINRGTTGSTIATTVSVVTNAASDVTNRLTAVITQLGTDAAAFTLGQLEHYRAQQATIGAGSTVTTQIGFHAASNLIGATTNYGFYGNIPSGTNRWNLFMEGTANNYFNGGLNIGATSFAARSSIAITRNISGDPNSYGIINTSQVQSGVTSFAGYNVTSASTQAATFTLTNLSHYYAEQSTFGAGSVVTNQMGFQVHPTLIGGVSNYGFRGQIPAGANRWNIFMDGTAQNYLAGTLLIGTTGNNSTGALLQVTGAGTFTSSITASSIIRSGGLSTQFLKADGSVDSTSYQPLLTNPVSGTGTPSRIAMFTSGSTVIGNSQIFQSIDEVAGTMIGIGGDPNAAPILSRLYVNGTSYMAGSITATGAISTSESITASFFVRAGGTAAQLLAANGSVVTAGTNITISGGTISASGGISSLNGLTGATQTFATGTSGSDFNISSAGTTHTFNIPTASSSTRGLLSAADWVIFANRISGSGTTNYIPKFNGATSLANSLIFDNGTNVSIGTTTNSGELLTAYGASEAAIVFQNSTTETGAGNGLYLGVLNSENYLWTYENQPLIFGANNTERMRITSGGNVGIGTSSPLSRFQVNGLTTIANGNGDFLNFKFSQAFGNTSLSAVFDGSTDSANSLAFKINNAAGNSVERVIINGAGNVGIGTSSPNQKLTIADAAFPILGFNIGSTAQGYIGSLNGGGIALNSQLAQPLMFYTTDAERMRITSGGNVGVGGTNPSARLEVIGGSFAVNTNTGTVTPNTTASFRSINTTATDRVLEAYSISYSALFYLQNNGSYFFAGSNLSDARAKKDITYFNEPILDKVMQLKPASFRYTQNDENIKGGFIAQEVKEIFPDLVTKTQDEDDLMGVDYYGVIALLTKAVQELTEKVNKLENK